MITVIIMFTLLEESWQWRELRAGCAFVYFAQMREKATKEWVLAVVQMVQIVSVYTREGENDVA